MRHNHAVALRPSLQPPTHGTRPRIRWATSLSRARGRPTRQVNEDSHMPYSRRWGALSSPTLNGWPVLAPHPVHRTTTRGCMSSTLFIYGWGHLSFCVGSEIHFQRSTKALGRSPPTGGHLINLQTPTSSADRSGSHPQATPCQRSQVSHLPPQPRIQTDVMLRQGSGLGTPPHNPHSSTSPRQRHTPHLRRSIHEIQHLDFRPNRHQNHTLPRPSHDRPQELRRAPEPPFRIQNHLGGDSGFTAGLSAGILFFHPSTRILEDTVSKLETTDLRLKDAEQSYLNHYSEAESVRLPCDTGGVGGDVEDDAVGYEDRPLYCRQDLRLRNEVPERDVRPNVGVRPKET